MKRKQFIKNAALTAAGSMVVPYILPSGRLFAASGSRRANHVVVCVFGGGVRNLESVGKAEGNLMRNMLNGTESISADIAPGVTILPTIAPTPLQNIGTLFKKFQYASGPTGHYNAHAALMTGVYSDQSIQLKQPPPFPTVFEYYRKHNSPTNNALNAWWVSNSLGPYPFLNYSTYDGYGAAYGANMIQPYSFFTQYPSLANPVSFTQTEKSKCDMMRDFANGQFKIPAQAASSGIVNSPADAEKLQTFLNRIMNDIVTGAIPQDPWGVGSSMNGDMRNIYLGMEVLKEFKPELMVINMTDIDIGHFDYTKYVNAIGLADYALAKLWNTIQTTSGLANDTVLIVVPEHGRNQLPNTVVDAYGRKALDHNNDEMSREVFCLLAGAGIKQGQVINAVQGETIDIVPTVANVLGFDNDMPFGMLSGRVLNESYI